MVLLTSAFDTWQLYGILRILRSAHVSNESRRESRYFVVAHCYCYCYFGFDSHIAISGCSLLSQLFEDTLSLPWSKTYRLCHLNYNNTHFDPFCQISQHERKSFKTNPYVFDVMPNNFRCTDWRQDCCILYPVYIQEKSRNSPAER